MRSILSFGKSECILNGTRRGDARRSHLRIGAQAEQILPCDGATMKIVRKRLSSICDFCLESKSVVD